MPDMCLRILQLKCIENNQHKRKRHWTNLSQILLFYLMHDLRMHFPHYYAERLFYPKECQAIKSIRVSIKTCFGVKFLLILKRQKHVEKIRNGMS